MPIRCMYCNQQGHNIRNCDHPNIMIHINLTKLYYYEIMRLGLNEEVARNLFKIKIETRFSLKEIKAIGAKYANLLTSLKKKVLVHYIWLHLQETMHVEPSLEPVWVEIIHNPQVAGMLSDDFIPFEPRNLNEDVARVETQPKKYNIIPSLSIIETREELEKCEECAICLENKKIADTVTINCGHKFCGGCITTTLKKHSNKYVAPTCALCRAPMTSFVVKNPEIYNLVSEHCIL